MPHAEAGPRFPGWALLLTLAALFAVQVTAFHPGVITPDTVFQWSQAVSNSYDDWHPPVTAWLWRQLMPLGPGTMPVLLFDCGLYWCGAGLCADALRRRGQPWAMAAALIVAGSPIPFGQMGAILKDPLLAACCLAAAGLILAMGDPVRPHTETFAPDGSIQPRPTGRRWMRLAATLLLVLACATRVNALFATVPLLVAVLPPQRTSGLTRIVVALVGAAALLVVTTSLIDHVALRPHRAQPIFSLVNFDLAGIVANGGAGAYPTLANGAARAITASCYTPRLYNPRDTPECNRVEDGLFAYATAQHISPLRIWLAAIGRSPGAYVRHRLAHLNQNWRLFVPAVPNDAVYVMSEPNPFGLSFVQGKGARLIARAATWMAWSPLGRPATWIAVAVGLMMIGPGLPSRRFILATTASALGYGGAYAVVSVAPDMRYNLWTMLAAAMALVVALADIASDRTIRPPTRRLWIATLPALLAVTIELAGLT